LQFQSAVGALLGVVNVTVTPLTGFPCASRTITLRLVKTPHPPGVNGDDWGFVDGTTDIVAGVPAAHAGTDDPATTTTDAESASAIKSRLVAGCLRDFVAPCTSVVMGYLTSALPLLLAILRKADSTPLR
jgi:hypothetical protein